ncbi:MAG: hypothetical protein ACPG4T_01240 [Nannocystaceae bacterium]
MASGTPSQAHAARKSNTQIRLPANGYLGDIDGDNLQDFIQIAGNRLFVTKVNANNTGILNRYEQHKFLRLVVGDFKKKGRDYICGIMSNHSLMCYGASTDRRKLWWSHTQPNFIAADEHAIVGDFDGNGKDDILVYRASSGSMRFYRHNGSSFVSMNISLGNLTNFDRRHKKIFVGKFGQDVAADDLLFWDPKTGRVSIYDSAVSNNQRTFWTKFKHVPATTPGETLHVANLEGGDFDGVVVAKSSGSFKLYQAKYANKKLKPLTTVDQGQVTKFSNVQYYWGNFVDRPNEPGGAKRDDVLLYRTNPKSFIRLSARYDTKKKRKTYWWGYTGKVPAHHSGWPTMQKDKYLVVKCRLKNDTGSVPYSDTWYKDLFHRSGRGKWNVYAFVRDVTYGTNWLDINFPSGWRTLAQTSSQYTALSRQAKINACITAWGVNRNPYKGVVSIVPNGVGYGASGTDVVLNNDIKDHNGVSHEIMHTYGLPHAFDDSGRKQASWTYPGQYHDIWDIMGFSGGGNSVYSKDRDYENNGPEPSTFHKDKLGVIPTHRILNLARTNSSSKKTKKIRIAPNHRPEVDGYLLVRIYTQESPSSPYLTVEMRHPSLWDEVLPNQAVLVRMVQPTPKPSDANHPIRGMVGYLSTKGAGPDVTVGESVTLQGMNVTVESFNATEGYAVVKLTY